MSGLQEIQSAIELLPKEQLAELLGWMRERDWEDWDHQLDSDIKSGKLDFLRDEALREKKNGSLGEL
jgi:hypothetical protein